MATGQKRITFVVNEELKEALAEEKKEAFYDRTQSEMLRLLIGAGIKTIRKEREQQKEKTLSE